MRIGIDVSLLAGNQTGVGVYLRELLFYFSEMDKENSYFLYSNKIINEGYIFPFQSTLSVVECSPHLRWQATVLPKLIKKDKIDLFWEPNQCMARMPKGPKYVVTIHDLAVLACPEYVSTKTLITSKLLLKKTCRRADAIIAISDYTKRDINEKLDIPLSKITRIYNGDSPYNSYTEYDENEWKSIRRKYSLNKFFLFVGSIHPRKNISVILKAYNKYCDKQTDPYQLVLAGAIGWNADEIVSQISNSKFKDNIIVTGFVDDNELKYFYKNAEALVFTSRYEGFGLPLLEAMTSGIRVITSNVTSLPEIVNDSALLLNDIDDDEELSDLMIEMHNMDDETKQDMIFKGYKRALLFNRRECAKQTMQLFKSL